MNERRDEREERTRKILEPHQLDPSLMRHACIAAVGYLTGASIQNKEQMIATLREAVTTPCAGWETFNSLRAELADLRKQLAESRTDRDNFQCQLKAFDKLHWELVDLFDKEARGVSPLHYVKERIAVQAAELEKLRVHNETLVREHKEVAVEVSALHVEIENMRYAADVGLTEEANRADRWVGHARRLFKLKCEYSQKCREKDAELATLRERLAAAERLFDAFARYGSSNGNPAKMRLTDSLFAMYQPAWDGAEQGWYLINYPNPVAKSGPHQSPLDVVLAAIAAAWIPPSTKGEG